MISTICDCGIEAEHSHPARVRNAGVVCSRCGGPTDWFGSHSEAHLVWYRCVDDGCRQVVTTLGWI